MSLKARRLLRRALFAASLLSLAFTAFAVAVMAIALQALRPAPEEWSTTVQIGPWQRELSMPGLIRWAMHPLAAPLLDGHILRTRFGRWQLHRNGHTLEAVCAPCRLHVGALGPAPLEVSRARLIAVHEGAGRFSGSLTLAEGSREAAVTFVAQLARGGADVRLTMPPTEIATLVQVFGHDLPEAAFVQVNGTLAFVATARWPEGTLQAKTDVRDFAVAGLGTEKLLDAQLPPACRTSAGDAAAISGWLPRAVVAAEDAHFYEHPGYRIDDLLAAWQHNQRDGARVDPASPVNANPRGGRAGLARPWGHASLRGGSTLTQQLAKLTITGDDRSASRKLRELLYAVEMERTLGKARILQLYLALAPWGDGVCGAERAAQVYLGRSASKVGPVSAAWLVSLLRNPEAQLTRYARSREIDRERVRQIVAGMRPMNSTQRTLANEQLQEWLP